MKKTSYWMTFCLIFFGGAVFGDQELFPKTSYLHYLQYLFYQKQGDGERALAELVLAYETNPQAPELLAEIVDLALRSGKLDLAGRYLERAAGAQPHDPKIRLMRAQLLHARGDSQQALRELHEAHRADSQDTQILLEMAAIYADLEMRQETLRYLELYLQLEPASPELLKIKADYQLQERDRGALETYKEAVIADPEDEEAFEGFARAHRVFSSTSVMREALLEVVKDHPESPMLRKRLCALIEESQLRESCWREFLEQDPGNIEALARLLDLYDKKEQWAEALDVLREYESHFAQTPFYILKESFYLIQSGELDEAVSVLERAARGHPDNLEIAYFLSLGYQDIGHYRQAVDAMAQIYRLRPDWKEMAYNYALLLGEVGDTAVMEEVLAHLVRRYPDDASLLNALGYTWAERGKNFEQAKALVEKALTEEPQNYYYLDSLGWVLFRMGKGEEGGEMVYQASLKSNDPEIMLHLARIRDSQGRHEQAWNSYYSARFDLARRKHLTPRLAQELENTEKNLQRRHRPSPQAILASRSAQLDDFAGLFRCEWGIGRQPAFRAKLGIKRNADSDHLELLIWPPGGFLPLDAQQFSEMLPAGKRGLLRDLAQAMDEFFYHRYWAATGDRGTWGAGGAVPAATGGRGTLGAGPESETPAPGAPEALIRGADPAAAAAPSQNIRRWQVEDNLTVNFKGADFRLKFYDFYSASTQGSIQGVLPRYIGIHASFMQGTCEALSYEKQ